MTIGEGLYPAPPEPTIGLTVHTPPWPWPQPVDPALIAAVQNVANALEKIAAALLANGNPQKDSVRDTVKDSGAKGE